MKEQPKIKNKRVVQGISWGDREFLNRAKQRADALDLNLSDYVCKLVKKDLKIGGSMILGEGLNSPAVGFVAEVGSKVHEENSHAPKPGPSARPESTQQRPEAAPSAGAKKASAPKKNQE